jgi:hypothetical protein
MEEVDAKAVSWDVEFVVLAEELCSSRSEQPRLLFCGFLVYRFENLEGRRQAFSLLVEYESTLLHYRGSEKANISRTR